MTHPAIPVLALVFSSCLWGLSWIPLKAFNNMGFDGLFLTLSGQLILALLFAPFGFRMQFFKSHIKPLAGIFIAGGSAILCFMYAMTYGDVVRVMVLFYLLPVWGVLGGRIFLGERIDFVRWLGVGLALVGAYFILGGAKVFVAPPSWIDFLAFLSGLFFAANNLFFRGVEAVPLPTKLFTMFSGCSVICIVFLVFGSESIPLDNAAGDYLWLVVYALTWLLVANWAAQWAITQMEAGRSSIIIIVELFAAVISAIWIGDRELSTGEALGCVLVVVAALLEALRVNPPVEAQENADFAT